MMVSRTENTKSNNDMNWNQIKRFCFTYAIDGGAWIEDATGNRDWVCFKIIREKLGQLWIDRQMRKTGWMTGCWIDCEN